MRILPQWRLAWPVWLRSLPTFLTRFTAHAKDIYHEYVKPEDMKRKICDAAHVVTVSDFNVGYLQGDLRS